MKQKEMVITVLLSNDGRVSAFVHNNLKYKNGFPINDWIHHYNSFDEAVNNIDLFFQDKKLLEKNLESTLNECIFSSKYISKNIMRSSNVIRRRVKKNLEKTAKQIREYYLDILADTNENRISVHISEITLISVNLNEDD